MHGKFSELHCNVLLISNCGEKVQKLGKLGYKFVPYFIYFLWHSPRDWRTLIHCNVVLTILHTWRHIFFVWKISGTAFWWIVVFQSRGDCLRMYTSFMVPGSKSATYPFSSVTCHMSQLPVTWPSLYAAAMNLKVRESLPTAMEVYQDIYICLLCEPILPILPPPP